MTFVDRLNTAFMLYMQALEVATTDEVARLSNAGLSEDEVKELIRQDIDRHHTFIGTFGE